MMCSPAKVPPVTTSSAKTITSHTSSTATDPILGNINDLRRVLLSYAYRLGIRRQIDREDIVQDTFVNLCKVKHRLDPDRNVRSFAMTTLRLLYYGKCEIIAKDKLRRQSARLQPNYTPPVNGASVEIRQACRIMAEKLSPSEAMNVVLAARGYDATERAEMLGRTVTGVGVGLSTSRRKLAQAMGYTSSTVN